MTSFPSTRLGILRILVAALLASGLPVAVAQRGEANCGSIKNAYGPFDYRNQRKKLGVVEAFHFSPKVESLAGGDTGRIEGDLDYVLRASPNHHRALIALTKLGVRKRSLQPGDLPRPIECYFDRAIRFRPVDAVARMLYVKFLMGQQRSADALRELDLVGAMKHENPMTPFNAGLLYLELKAYDKALAQAHAAMSMGHQAAALREELQKVGHWREPDTAVAPPDSSASQPRS